MHCTVSIDRLPRREGSLAYLLHVIKWEKINKNYLAIRTTTLLYPVRLSKQREGGGSGLCCCSICLDVGLLFLLFAVLKNENSFYTD